MRRSVEYKKQTAASHEAGDPSMIALVTSNGERNWKIFLGLKTN